MPEPADDEPLRIVFFGTYDVTTHPRVQVLIEGLRAAGDDVVECNEPLGIGTADRVGALTRPAALPRVAMQVLRCWLVLLRRGRRLRRPRPDAVVVGYLGQFDVHLARLVFGRVPLVLDQMVFAGDTAVDRGLGGGRLQRLLGLVDRAALRRADVVAVDTPEHVELMPAPLRDRAVVVPVGAPAEWFAQRGEPRAESADGPLRVVFYGLYTPLQGAPVIGRALGLLADCDRIEVTMAGAGQELAATRAAAAGNPRVTWLEWVPAAELPAVVAGHDVCLGIFGTGSKALRVVPNKVYQGAAAGCAVVTSDTAPQRAALGDDALLVPPGDHAALADALRRLADDRALLADLRARSAALAARDFRPARVVEPLRAALAGRAP